MALKVRDALTAAGWPEPVYADSGNGAHLDYYVDLPADDGGLIENCLKALALRFDTDTVKVDTSVFNPARIWKLYGTTAGKGDSIPDRPHRMARLLSVPSGLDIVPRHLLEALVNSVPDAKPQAAPVSYNGQFDLDKWISDHGLKLRGPEPWQGGQRWVFDICPWNPDHTNNSAFIVQGSDGKLGAGCHHNGCNGKDWHALRDTVEPGWRDKKKTRVSGGQNAHPKNANDIKPLTDSGLAERFAKRHGDKVRYCHPWNKGLAWDGMRWRIDDTGAVDLLAKETARAILAEAATVDDDDARRKLVSFERQSEAAARREAMLRLARCEPPIPILPDVLDRDPWFLNCPNGTIELKTGALREHRQSDFITKLCPVRFVREANCPIWLSYLDVIFEKHYELIDFIQRFCGYILTGDVSEQVLPIFYGVGANGKSTFVNAILNMLGGDYSIKSPPDFLVRKKQDSHPTEIADLYGKRLIAAIETDEGRRLAESLVKELTGGDRIRARRMREDFWEFAPTHKVILACNHKPEVRGTDHAIWRRIRLVPFKVIIPREKQDKRLPEKLKAELPGILAWCVRGCLDWQRDGLGYPPDVEKATESYRSDQDALGTFLLERCVTGPAFKARAGEIYDAYKRHCETAGEYALTQRRFGAQLSERGFERFTNNGVWYEGVGLITEGTEGYGT
jgi:putative DNA primase/helicase